MSEMWLVHREDPHGVDEQLRLSTLSDVARPGGNHRGVRRGACGLRRRGFTEATQDGLPKST